MIFRATSGNCYVCFASIKQPITDHETRQESEPACTVKSDDMDPFSFMFGGSSFRSSSSSSSTTTFGAFSNTASSSFPIPKIENTNEEKEE